MEEGEERYWPWRHRPVISLLASRDHLGLEGLRTVPFSVAVNPMEAMGTKHMNVPRQFNV